MKNKIVVIGCGRLGASIANDVSFRGKDVIVLDKDENSFARLDENFSGLKLVGNCSTIDELKEAQIESADEVVIATGDDNVNLLVTYLCAKLIRVPHIFVRFDDPDKSYLIQGMPVRAIYPFMLSKKSYNQYRGLEETEETK